MCQCTMHRGKGNLCMPLHTLPMSLHILPAILSAYVALRLNSLPMLHMLPMPLRILLMSLHLLSLSLQCYASTYTAHVSTLTICEACFVNGRFSSLFETLWGCYGSEMGSKPFCMFCLLHVL